MKFSFFPRKVAAMRSKAWLSNLLHKTGYKYNLLILITRFHFFLFSFYSTFHSKVHNSNFSHHQPYISSHNNLFAFDKSLEQLRYHLLKVGAIYQNNQFFQIVNQLYVTLSFIPQLLNIVLSPFKSASSSSVIPSLVLITSLFRGSGSHPWMFHQETGLPCRVRKSCEFRCKKLLLPCELSCLSFLPTLHTLHVEGPQSLVH